MYTDRDALRGIFDMFGIEVREMGKSFTAAARRFYFNEDGDLVKILDYTLLDRYLSDERRGKDGKKRKYYWHRS